MTTAMILRIVNLLAFSNDSNQVVSEITGWFTWSGEFIHKCLDVNSLNLTKTERLRLLSVHEPPIHKELLL